MSYQGERARNMAAEKARYFEVSKIHLGADDQVSEVLWSEVDTGSNQAVGKRST